MSMLVSRGTKNSGPSTAAYSPTCATPPTRLRVSGWKTQMPSTPSANTAIPAAGCAEPRPRSASTSARLAPNAAMRTTIRAHPMSPTISASWHRSWKRMNAGTHGNAPFGRLRGERTGAA
jgi:hypothetical protein